MSDNGADEPGDRNTQFQDRITDEVESQADEIFAEMPEKISVRLPEAYRRRLALNMALGDTDRYTDAITDALGLAFSANYLQVSHWPSVAWQYPGREPGFVCPECGTDDPFALCVHPTEEQRGTVVSPRTWNIYCLACGHDSIGADFEDAAAESLTLQEDD